MPPGTSDLAPEACLAPADPREPWLTFEIPRNNDLSLFGTTIPDGAAAGGQYGVLLPDARFWARAASALLVGMTLAVLLASVVHRFVVRRRGSAVSTLAALGLVAPACVLFPYAYVRATDELNTAVRFCACVPSVLYLFRTSEAYFGYGPDWAERSLGSYCLYYVFPGELVRDRKTGAPIEAKRDDVTRAARSLLVALASVTVMMSLLSPFGYVPFESRAGEFHEPIVLSDYLSAGHLANSFAAAMMFQQCLALGMSSFGAIMEGAAGVKTLEVMRNPMLEATSVTDFWSRRWNLLIHGVLKRGVYKPVRGASTALVATVAAFVASGLFHEWLVHVCFIYGRPMVPSCGGGGASLLGSNTAFFVWNAVTMAAERVLGGSKRFRTLGESMPRAAVTFLIVMTSLPVAHWFGNPYIEGGFFYDYQLGFPMITKIR